MSGQIKPIHATSPRITKESKSTRVQDNISYAFLCFCLSVLVGFMTTHWLRYDENLYYFAGINLTFFPLLLLLLLQLITACNLFTYLPIKRLFSVLVAVWLIHMTGSYAGIIWARGNNPFWPISTTWHLFFSAFLVGIVFLAVRRRLSLISNHFSKPHHCPECHYLLIGLTKPTCPECGKRFRPRMLGLKRIEGQFQPHGKLGPVGKRFIWSITDGIPFDERTHHASTRAHG